MTEKASICVVLDRSGSMESCRSDALGAVNSYLRQVRDDETIDGTVSVIIFDSESIDCIRDRCSATTCPPLEDSEYEPRGMTPLLDAVGQDNRSGMDSVQVCPAGSVHASMPVLD